MNNQKFEQQLSKYGEIIKYTVKYSIYTKTAASAVITYKNLDQLCKLLP
jgi:predicted secreted Zn-dependent protease